MPDTDALTLFNEFGAVRTIYGQLHSDIDEDESFINGTFEHNFIPDKYMDDGLKPTIPPTAYNAVENAADHILTTPKFTFPPRPLEDSKEAAAATADHFTTFFNLWWHRVAMDQGDPLRVTRKSIVKGRAIIKKTIRFDLLPGMPNNATERKNFREMLNKVGKRRFIWDIEALPIKSVYEDPDHPWDPEFVYEEKQIRVAALERAFDMATAPEAVQKLVASHNRDDKIKWLEYYSRPRRGSQGQHITWIENEVLQEGVNPYNWESPLSTPKKLDFEGYVPYFIADPGWGYGGTESFAKPEDRYVSIIRPLLSIFEAEGRQLTAVESWLRFYIWPFIIARGMPDIATGERQISFGPGAIENLDAEENLEVMSLGDVPLAPFQFLDKVQRIADQGAKITQLGGTPQIGVESATEADLNVRNASTKLSGPVSGMRRMVSRMAQSTLQDIEKVFEAPITLYGAVAPSEGEVRLRPTDINGYHHVFVEMQTSDEAALDARNARLWADLSRIWTNLSEDTAMSKAGIPNTQEEADKAAIERVLQSEPMEMSRVLMALSGMGELGQMLQQIFIQQAQGNGAAQGGGPNAQLGDEATLTQASVNPAVAQLQAQSQAGALVDQGDRNFF